MSFFKLSTGEMPETTGTIDTSAPELIPDNTTLQCVIKDTKINISTEYGDSLQVQWQCVKPAQFANRVVFQNIKIFEKDDKKRDKAIKMFCAIDQNATGGKLVASGQEPTTQALQSWLNKQMLIKVMVWDLDGRKGNWISAVSPKQSGEAQPVAAPISQPSIQEMDDDVPF